MALLLLAAMALLLVYVYRPAIDYLTPIIQKALL